jgi:hypothetical protein
MEDLIKTLLSDYGNLGITGVLAYIVWQMSSKLAEINSNHLTHIQSSMESLLSEIKELRNDIKDILKNK